MTPSYLQVKVWQVFISIFYDYFYLIINGRAIGSVYYSFFTFTLHIYFIYPETCESCFLGFISTTTFLFYFYFRKFRQLMSSGLLLSTFQNTQPTQIFKTTPTTPQFFKTHLVDPLRIIKILKDDPNACERVFYYQYLKLCTCEQGYPDIRTQNLRIIVQSPQFYFIFPADCNNKHYTDEKFKSLALQFLDVLPQNMGKLDQLLNRYPVVDLVMVYMMRSLLIINGIAEETEQFVDKNDVISVLSNILDVQYSCFGQCVKFGESDVFLLQQSPFQIYMAYLKAKQQDPPKQFLTSKLTTKKSSKKERNELYKSNTSNQCYQFVDYTGLGVERLPTGHTNLFQSENLSLKSPTRSMLKNKQANDSKFPVFQPFKEVAQIREADILTVDEKDKSRVQDEVQQFYQESDEQVMNVDVSEQTSQFPQITANRQQQHVDGKANSQNNRESGYESEQDEPKYKICIPGTIQKQERASSTEVEQSRMQDHSAKPQIRGESDKQKKNEELETKKMQNPEQQRQFSFKNKVFKQEVQQIESTYRIKEQNQSNNEPSKRKDQFQVKVDLPEKQYKYSDESNQVDKVSKNSYMSSGATSAAILSSISITPYSYNTHNSTSAFYSTIPASNTPPYTPPSHYSYQDPNKYNQLDHKYTVKKSVPSFMDIIQNTSTYSNTHLGSRQLPWQRTGCVNGHVGNPQIRLNVTKQFTNSLIMKQMPESYREGVKKARERARVYRKTLMSSQQ